jgi:hypothetical protein
MLPNTFTELAQIIRSGVVFQVQMKKLIESCDSYPEENMRATIAGEVIDTEDNFFRILFDYTAYDEYNKAFESSNYYDKNGKACLTARQSGYYQIKETLWFRGDSNPNDYFEVIPGSQSKWMKLFMKERLDEETYAHFLERKLDEMTA